jgi:crossover junction endodeoxyribonuclease RuvC
MVVMGVDVGIRVCGFCICRIHNVEVTLIKQGEVKPHPKKLLPEKLAYIFEGLKNELITHDVGAIVVEVLYSHHKHPTTLGVLAQVRGVVALLSQQQGIGFFEYASTRARKSLLGRGSVNSAQVRKMAENMTGCSFLSEHTADAYSLAVAFSHAHKLSSLKIAS